MRTAPGAIMRHLLSRSFVGIAALTVTVPALAQVQAQPAGRGLAGSYDRAADRLAAVEEAVRDLQASVYSVEGGQRPLAAQPAPRQAPAADASTVIRLQELEQQVAELTGRIEELTFRLASQQRQINTMLEVIGTPDPMAGPTVSGAEETDEGAQPQELAEAVQAGEGSTTSEPATMVELPDDPDEAYDVAYEALLAGDYPRAEASFAAYSAKFPEGVRTPEAKYLLGEIYLATGAYKEAASTFLDHVRSYPEDPRAAEAYLKLGTAFARLDRADEACKLFAASESKFPDASQSVKARLSAERNRVGCAAG
ncbi:tol-pal system protein YbgF [Parvularcula dongshanensis]|uniref:Cell division coordinator CpoB n=1 Tax=Parvularcula dongshanensis TaxID=1173995 RepID=A0A840I4W6_9PROT|nr:tol-pal system protein YbgF [Parvularcula dongshanensis]MBB4660006.1 tol-pal system protein YbgF [Parvularcula dongshanensis]